MSDASMRSVLVKMAAAAAAGLAVWTALGVLAVTSPGGTRIGLLPPLWMLGCFMLLFAAVVAQAPRIALALFALTLSILPWFPTRIPPAFLVWMRPLLVLIAAAAVLGLAFQVARRATAPWSHIAADTRRAPLLIAVLSVVLYGAAAWRVAPMIPGGDEPHYLIITQSLLSDFDLKIENNHARGDYRSYVDVALRPDYIVRGTDGEIYSIHMPGLSVLVAPAFLIAGYPGAVAFMILLAAIGGALLWRLAFVVTGDPWAAWFGWASIALSVPIVFHSFTIYPDAAAVLFVLLGVLALFQASRRDAADSRLLPWLGFGAALAVLPWLHARFALVAGGLGVFIVARLARDPWAWRKGAAFLSLPLVSAAAWFAFFQVIYGSPNPRAQYGGLLDAISSPTFITSGIGGLFLDQQFGIVPRAPVFLCGIAGTLLMLRKAREKPGHSLASHRRLALEILLLVVPYLVSTTTMRMWWGGWSAPARFVVPLIPLFGFGAAVAWHRARRRATRGVMLAALAISTACTLAFVWVDRGRLAYDIRQADALWLEWAGPLADLARGLPTFLRTPEPAAWLQSVVWLIALIGSWLLIRSFHRVTQNRLAVGLALVGVYAVTGMLAISVVWRLNSASGIRPLPAQVNLLRAVAEDRGLGVAFDPPVAMAAAQIPDRVTMVVHRQAAAGRSGEIAVVPGPLPPGSYTIEVLSAVGNGPTSASAGTAGRFSVGIGRQFVAAWDGALSGPSQKLSLNFPVYVRGIVVAADQAAARSIESIAVRASSIVGSHQRLTNEVARQVSRYGSARVYFLDEGTYPEADAFWIRGARRAQVVIDRPQQSPTLSLFIRNGPVENTLTIEAGRWRVQLELAPSEERVVAVPSSPSGSSTLLRFATGSGFRPSHVVPSSRDHRFLGVWVRLVD